jgi:molybdate transport system substrate-binding protein
MTTKLFLLLSIALVLLSCQDQQQSRARQSSVLTIAVAANVQFAMEAIEAAFEKAHDMEIDVVVSSSGKLATQIMQGAPYSVFLSANRAYPEAIIQDGQAEDTVLTYAYGTLVLWTARDIPLDTNLAFLQQASIQKIAVANPQSAPYGQQAINSLEKAQQQSLVNDKLIYGESVAQVNQYVLSGAVEVGFTSRSSVLAPASKGTGKWVEVPADYYEPIEQGVIRTKYGKKMHPKSSQAFLDFLFTHTAREILEQHGYRIAPF